MTPGEADSSPSRWREFAAVDAADDPALLSAQLDAIAAVPAVAAEKGRSLELLELGAGGRVLDVGCGNGSELLALADLVGAGGRVVGLDRSAALIGAARGRTTRSAPPIELVMGDAQALPFPDHEFDACRADRTLQHLARPAQALAEMARVMRPRGRLVVTESRWGLVAPDLDREVTGRVLDVMAAGSERHSTLPDRLPALMARSGLDTVRSLTSDHTLEDHEQFVRFTNLRWSLGAAVRLGAVADGAADAWWNALRALSERGDAFVAVRFVHVAGTKR